MKHTLRSAICFLLIFILSTGCAGCTAPPPSGSGYLDLVDSPSTTLNNVWYNTGGIFRCAVFDSLLSTEADMQTLRPALAESYTRSEDGLIYTFVLRDDVQWHDGEAFDAKDVLFSLRTMLRTREINGLLSSAFLYIDGAERYQSRESEEIGGVSVEGNRITVRLTSPVGDFLSAIAQFAILPEHLLGSVAPEELDSHDYWKRPVGCGPYRITEAVEDEYFILERYDAYYGPRAGVAKIRLRTHMDDCVAAMQAGTLDFYVTNDPTEIAKLKGVPNCTANRLNILFPAYLILNLSDDEGTNEDLRDPRVRRALLLAIDRETIVDAVFPGSTVSDTMIPAWDDWYAEDGVSYAFDPEEARRLLTEADFDFSRPIRLRYFTKGQSTADLMNAIAVYWRAVGIRVELSMFEGSGSRHMFEIRDYDICYKRLSAFNHAAIYEEMLGTGIMQSSIYRMPIYDGLIEQLDTTADEEARRAIVRQMQQLDQDQLLRLPLFALANVAYVNEARFCMPEAYGNLWYRYDLRFEDWRLVG